MKTYGGSGSTDLRIRDLDTSWKKVVSFTHRENSPRYLLDRRLGGPQGLDDMEKRKLLTLPGPELRPLGSPSRSQSLYQLSYRGTEAEDYNIESITHYIIVSVLALEVNLHFSSRSLLLWQVSY
jgi:hypothetical protein